MAAKPAPRQSLKKSIQSLEKMRDKLAEQMKKDADGGALRNEEREQFLAALSDAHDMMKDYLHTGAPASYWLRGQQSGLFEAIV